jgi:folate-dependent phosphoribosylglycinamide formyltransferase PurN
MRVVVFASSVYSETACAMAAHLSEAGYVPCGALALRTLDRSTLMRKIGQWGVRDVAHYAREKLFPPRDKAEIRFRSPYLAPFLNRGERPFHTLREVASFYEFPISFCENQNAPRSIVSLQAWSPDLIVFTGGNILRQGLLNVPRVGVLNVHLGLLPEIRGMSAPEWSLLKNVPVGITIHFMHSGIDTGPILQRYEFPHTNQCKSLSDLRHRLIAFGVEKAVEVIAALDRGTISATPQPNSEEDTQFFVMHEWLQARAAESFVNRPGRLAEVLSE